MGLSVLIVDPVQKRNICLEMLFMENPKVAIINHAYNSESARRICGKKTFDLAVISIKMPFESGYALADQLLYGGFIKSVALIGKEEQQAKTFLPICYIEADITRNSVDEIVKNAEDLISQKENGKTFYYVHHKTIGLMLDLNINRNINGLLYGVIYCPYMEEYIAFSGLDKAVLEINNICEKSESPKAERLKRSFFIKKGTNKNKTEKQKLTKQTRNNWQEDYIRFSVQIVSRRNGTFQGRLKWIENGKMCCFSSALQFMQLLLESFDMSQNITTG